MQSTLGLPLLSISVDPNDRDQFKLRGPLLLDLALIGFDACASLALALSLLARPAMIVVVAMGAIAAMLLDPLQLVHGFHPHEPLALIQRFDDSMHTKRHRDWPLGIISQIIFLVLAIGVTIVSETEMDYNYCAPIAGGTNGCLEFIRGYTRKVLDVAMPLARLLGWRKLVSSDDASEWSRCLVACLGTLAIGAALVLVLVIAVDPYDSGRFGFLGIEGVDDWTPATANASRARDLHFDSAVISNSTGQLLAPAELSRTSGNHFVQLASPGAEPGRSSSATYRCRSRAGPWECQSNCFAEGHSQASQPPRTGRDIGSHNSTRDFLSSLDHLSEG